MKNKILILISILAISCSKEETVKETEKTSLNLITGINFRETGDNKEMLLHLGNANILTNNKFLIYPNPATDKVYISAQENVTYIWFVKGNPEKIYQDFTFGNILNSDFYDEKSIVLNSKNSVNGQSSKEFSLNIETLEKGYYKVFIKIGGKIYWDNLYKYDNTEDTQKQSLSIKNFWK